MTAFRSHARRRCAGIVLAIMAIAAPVFATDLVFTPIALSGTDGALGPNEGSGKVFTNLGSANPSLNNNGQIVFRGDSTTSGASSGNLGLWTYAGGINTNFAIAAERTQPVEATEPADSPARSSETQVN